MSKTYAITLADNSKHYVTASSAAAAKAKIAYRGRIVSCKLCKD